MSACSRCYAELMPHESRCATCGAPCQPTTTEVWTSEIVPAQAAPAAKIESKPKARLGGLADNPWVVLATIFFVTAAFGIPLIWMCKAWTENQKVVLTVVTILYTIVILWLFYLVMAWCYNNIMQAL